MRLRQSTDVKERHLEIRTATPMDRNATHGPEQGANALKRQREDDDDDDEVEFLSANKLIPSQATSSIKAEVEFV